MDFKIFFKKLRNKFIFWKRKQFSLIKIDRKKKRLILHEKYERLVKWTLKVIFVIGIIMSIISIAWYFSLILTLFWGVLEYLLKKTGFMFTTLFIQPIPTPEDLKKANWYANLFGFVQGGVADKKFLIGISFKDKEAGEKVFKCISAWNNMEQVDMKNNINLSFIVENDKDYSTYIYPSVNREVIRKFESKIKKKGKDHNNLIYTLIMCKVFPYGKNSHFYKFKEEYQNYSLFTLNGEPQKYKPFTLKGFYFSNGGMIPLANPSIEKFHLKIKNREDLTKEDLEYEHGKFVKNL